MIRNRYLLAIDIPLIVAAAFGAFAMRFEWRFYETRAEFIPYVLLGVLVKPLVYYAFGLYQRVWRYAGLHDLVTVTTAVSAACGLTTIAVAVALIVDPTFQFSRVVIPADWLLSLAFAGGARISVRLLSERAEFVGRERQSGDRRRKRLLIAGAGEAGAMVVREIQRNPNLGFTAVGFLDDQPAKHLKRIHGVQVLGPTASLREILLDHPADEVLIAMPSAPGRAVRAISEACHECGVQSRTIPGVFELMDGQVSVSHVRQIEITDLLRREPIRGELDARQHIAGRTVLVTGGGGSIGQELCRQVVQAGAGRLILMGHGENSLFECQTQLREAFRDRRIDVVVADVRDRLRLFDIFRQRRPDIVFHAAAHKHVPMMQENPEEAVSNNVIGTKNVVEAALSTGVGHFVLISTDKAVAPSSVMGASKRMAEMVVVDAARSNAVPYSIVRFGNVLGSRGSVVPFFQRQIERGGPLTLTHRDMKRFFMTIPEAVHLVLQAASFARGGELFVLDMGEPVRIVDLATDLVKLGARRGEDIEIVFTGLRPGEKLEEALWESDARVDRTAHPKIWRVHEQEVCSGAELTGAVQRLLEAAERGDHLAIDAEFARAIPTYVPMSVPLV